MVYEVILRVKVSVPSISATFIDDMKTALDGESFITSTKDVQITELLEE